MNLFIKPFFLLIFFGCILSCSTSKNITDLKPSIDFEIIKSPFAFEKDTLILNELRFYKIQSALDAMKLMYLNYGKWSKKNQGNYQENINQLVWNNVTLLENTENFTVIACGTETLSDYFASLIVLDSSNIDCFNEDHPLKDKLIDLFTSKMNALDKDQSVYKLFK